METIATAAGAVSTAHGLTLLPSLAAGSAGAVRDLDRLVVPGRGARLQAAGLVAAVAASAPALRPTFPHADAPDRFALEPALEDVARTADAPTARFAMRRLEYRSATVRLDGSAIPWGVLALPLALAFTGWLVVRLVTALRISRGLAAAAAVIVLVAPAGAHAQSPDSTTTAANVATATAPRVRIDLVSADGGRGGWLGRRREQPLVGTLVGSRGDTLLLLVGTGGDPLRVPRSAIHATYESRGHPSRWRSALRSAVVPALAGAALRGAAAGIRRDDGGPSPARAALSGAAVSAAFAAAKGALFPKERWERVPLPATTAPAAAVMP